MKKGQCRICHSMQRVNKSNQVKSHKNKYTGRQCFGSFKPYVYGTVVTEQPLDYQEEEPVGTGGDIGGLVALYAGGVLTGIILGYWIF